MEQLVKKLIREGALSTPRIIDAFRAIDRVDFVQEGFEDEAYEDYPLPIGHGATISQPSTVAFLLELLQPESGNKILDAGFGSGWTTALLAHITGARGKVFSFEIIPEVKKFGEENIKKYNFIEKEVVETHEGSAENDLPNKAPFDRILSGAAAKEIPAAWKEQPATGGRIVAPVGDSVLLLTKNPDGSFSKEEHPGFAFVPFVTKNQ